ncbi:MAG TPA: ATP-binding protein [Chloroflexota bacterium]|nr:ATP-binding protein [Chloroflexota bacterium]
MIGSLRELFQALEAGDFDALQRTPESEWLDFKSQPYLLDHEHQKLELAKDLTAFANHVGGVILVGISTTRQPDTSWEVAGELRPIPKAMVSFDRYRASVEELTYPPLRSIDLHWYFESATHGVLCVYVPAAGPETRPILVRRVVDEAAHRQILVGLFQRTNDRVATMSAEQLHAQIQLGQLAQLGVLPSAFADMRAQAGPSSEELDERLAAELDAAELATARHYWLQAWPAATTMVRDLHVRDPQGLRQMLARPPSIREGGFNLQMAAYAPDLLPGGGLRIIDPDRQALSITPSGILTWACSIGPEYLGWAIEQYRRGGINPIAIVESTMEFCRFLIGQVVSRADVDLSAWRVRGGMAQLHDGHARAALVPGRPRTPFPHTWTESPADGYTFEPMPLTASAGQAAFALLRLVYLQFGLDASAIPFSDGDAVSEDLIRHAR